MVAVIARKVVIAIPVFTFNLCTSQDAFEQKHLELLFLELFLFMFFRVIFVSDFNIPKKLVLTQLVAHAVMAFQTISNKQKNRQTVKQTNNCKHEDQF